MSSRSQKAPSEFRCLKALYPTAIAFLVIFAWEIAGEVICGLATSSDTTCQVSMPSPLIWVLLLFVSIGLIHFIYRIYRDFFCGDLRHDRGQA